MNHTEKNIRMMMKVIRDAHEHIKMKTPNRVWSTYFRYALNELEKGSENISTSMLENPDQKSTHEHTIPFKIIRDKLLAIDDITFESVRDVLKRFHVVCTISNEEDQKLKIAGLNSKMPEAWDEKNPFARYDAVGISYSTKKLNTMTQTTVIIAQINLRNSYEDFYSGDNTPDHTYLYLKESLKKHLSDQGQENISVSDVYTFEKVDELIKATAGKKIIIFSNFPPNNSYKRFKKEEVGGSFGSLADSYDRTVQKYKEIMKDYPNIQLHIVTGAPEALISNQQIRTISDHDRIFLTRRTPSFDLKKHDQYIKSVLDRSSTQIAPADT